MREAVVFDRVANLVGDVGLEPALVDVEHFVEHAGDVKAQGVHAAELLARSYLLVGEPLLVGEGKLQFVAVKGGL